MPSNRHVNVALSDLSLKTLQDTSNFNIAPVVAPIKKVQKESDVFYIYNVPDQFREQDDIRANKAPAKEIDLTALSTSSYRLVTHALKTLVSDRDRENADPAVNPDTDAVQELTDKLLLGKETIVAKTFFTSTSFGTNLTTLSSNAWDLDTTTSTPIDDADTAINGVMKATGQVVNNLVIGKETFDVLKDHTDILDRIKWSERGIITEDLLASVLGVGEVTVGKSIRTSTSPGISATTNYVFNNKALFLYNTSTPGIKSANCGISFTGVGAGNMPQVKKYRDDSLEGDWLELQWRYDIKLVQSLSGYMFAAVNS